MSAGGRDEERRKLADIIHHWNANRLDLFEISQPTEVSAAAAGVSRGRGARGPATRRPRGWGEQSAVGSRGRPSPAGLPACLPAGGPALARGPVPSASAHRAGQRGP